MKTVSKSNNSFFNREKMFGKRVFGGRTDGDSEKRGQATVFL